MVADLPPSYHTREDIHEQTNIDEASFQADVGNITDPDLIASGDFKVFEAIDPWTHIVNTGLGIPFKIPVNI